MENEKINQCPNCGSLNTDDSISKRGGYWRELYDWIVKCRDCGQIFGIYYQ